MADELLVGLLGCGGMGRTLARALGAVPRARLARVCDAAAAAAQACGEQLGVPWTTEVDAVLGDPAIGAVIVATPNFTHAELVCRAAEAGKHIFCEKPLALSVADCDRMIAAARRHGVHLCVGHVLRYLPVFDTMKRLIDGGTIGRPFAVRISRLGGWGDVQPWRQKRELCGGPLFEVHVHELDYMRYILGEPAVVYATGSQEVVRHTDFEDTAFVSVRFVAGGHGVLHSSSAAALGGYTGVIQGTEGTIAFTNWPGRIEWKRFDGRGEVLSGEQITAPEEAHQRELRQLVEAALDGKEPAIRGEDGRAAVAMAEAAVTSMQTGRPVPLGPAGA
jgi:myo-inositol 2-dehydrogenase/D-chiro-inositol 1-dehydrogenase